jgi:putative ABC transport system ATP-binding protein
MAPSPPEPLGPAVRLTDVSKHYAQGAVAVEALRNVTLSIPCGSFTMITGASGSGKSTLLNVIGCLDPPSSGEVEVAGRDVLRLNDNARTDLRAREIGFVFQSYSLVETLTVEENVEYPILLSGVPRRERAERVGALLAAVGLEALRKRFPNSLSGGQKQRVAIARALVGRPTLVLADEPTANLDAQTGAEIIALMQKMQADENVTFVFSTHDPRLVQFADAVFALRDGRLEERGG